MAAIAPYQPPPQQIPQPVVAAAPPLAQDPLFEALAKYVTSGPGSSSISAAAIQEIIDTHVNVPGGREYLQSIVQPEPPIQPIIWPNEGVADGFLSTNLSRLTLSFNARPKYKADETGIPLVINFYGFASGLFPMQPVLMFSDAQFFWGATIPDGDVNFELTFNSSVPTITVKFYHQIKTPETPNNPIAELDIVPNNIITLPSHMSVNGSGTFRSAQ